MVAAIVQTRLYVFGRSIDFDFDRCRGQFVSTRPMPIPLNFGIAASLVVDWRPRERDRGNLRTESWIGGHSCPGRRLRQAVAIHSHRLNGRALAAADSSDCNLPTAHTTPPPPQPPPPPLHSPPLHSHSQSHSTTTPLPSHSTTTHTPLRYTTTSTCPAIPSALLLLLLPLLLTPASDPGVLPPLQLSTLPLLLIRHISKRV